MRLPAFANMIRMDKQTQVQEASGKNRKWLQDKEVGISDAAWKEICGK